MLHAMGCHMPLDTWHITSIPTACGQFMQMIFLWDTPCGCQPCTQLCAVSSCALWNLCRDSNGENRLVHFRQTKIFFFFYHPFLLLARKWEARGERERKSKENNLRTTQHGCSLRHLPALPLQSFPDWQPLAPSCLYLSLSLFPAWKKVR